VYVLTTTSLADRRVTACPQPRKERKEGEEDEDEDEEQQIQTRQVLASDAMVRRLELQRGVERATLKFSSSCRRSKIDQEWLRELTYMGT